MDWGDERAQALQVGAVLLLGIAVIGLSIYQVTVVPQENREVEFNSYLDASTDMSDLRNDVLASAQRGVQSGTTVSTGTSYPARALFVNPPPASGRLDTLESRNVTIEGAVAVDNGGDEQRVVGAVWNGSARNYSTRAIQFQPGYNRLDTSPVVVDGGSVYRDTENGPIPLAGQTLVDGNRITLVTVGGNLSTGGLASTVTAEPVSTVERTVTVTGDGGDDFNVTLRFASSGDADAWNDSRVAADYRDQGVDTTHPVGESYVNVTFDGSETYELRLARVTVREASEAFAESEPDPEYVFPYAGNESEVVNNSAVTLTAEVRDRYNNPVTGTEVTFQSPNGTFAVSGTDTRTVTTTADGRATVAFTPNATGTVNVTASFAEPTPFNTARFELDVTEVGGGGGGGVDQVNPSGAGDVILVEQAGVGQGGSSDVTITLQNNTGASNQVNITRVRMNYYFDGNSGGGGDDPSLGSEVEIYATEQGVDSPDSTTITIGGSYETLGTSIPLDPYSSDTGDRTVIDLDFDPTPGGQTTDVEPEDFYILSIQAEIDGTTRTFTYFVSHPK